MSVKVKPMDLLGCDLDEAAARLADVDPRELALMFRCVMNESNVYRKAVVNLVCDATSGARKTIDKELIAAVLGRALEAGNEWHRRALT